MLSLDFYSFAENSFLGTFKGWGYQDFAAGVIVGAAATLTANQNGNNIPFNAAKVIDGSAIIVRTPETDYSETVRKVYSSASAILGSTIAVTDHTDASITLNAIPHASWKCRIYYLYNYSAGIPVDYSVPPKGVSSYLFSELQTLLITEEELTGGTKSPTFVDVTINTPSNIYALNHNSFLNGAGNQHIDWTNASESISTTGDVAAASFIINEPAALVLSGSQIESASSIVIKSASTILLKPSGDVDDYFSFSTVDHVPTIGTAGGCNLKITADSGTIDFDDEILKTTGNLTDGVDSLTVANAKAAYDHSIDNTQAHTDYLLNTVAGDTALGTITMPHLTLNSSTSEINFGDAGATDTLNIIGQGAGANLVNITNAAASNSMGLTLSSTAAGWTTTGNLTFVSSTGDISLQATTAGEYIELKGPTLFSKTELTIDAAGAVAPVRTYHTIDTESDDATDDLETITGTASGQMIIIRPANDARTVVVKNGTGNIVCGKTGGDVTLDDETDTFMAIYDLSLTKWLEL